MQVLHFFLMNAMHFGDVEATKLGHELAKINNEATYYLFF